MRTPPNVSGSGLIKSFSRTRRPNKNVSEDSLIFMFTKINLLIQLSQIIIASLLMCCCSAILQETAQIKNVSKQEVIVIHKRRDQGNVQGIKIRISGKIAGTATIQLLLNSGTYKKEEIKDKVNFFWEGDWYQDDAEIRYIPDTVATGDLTINYEFLEL